MRDFDSCVDTYLRFCNSGKLGETTARLGTHESWVLSADTEQEEHAIAVVDPSLPGYHELSCGILYNKLLVGGVTHLQIFMPVLVDGAKL